MEKACAPFRIVARQNGVGLDRDVELIKRALPGGQHVEHHTMRSLRPILEAVTDWFPGDESTPINILVERIPLTWTVGPGTTALIPNQERFPKRHLHRLRGIDTVFCKSRHAELIFRDLGIRTRYIGFTSIDRKLPELQPNYGKFLHLAGRSTLKGTDVVLRLWEQHPDWPRLTLVQHADNAPGRVPENVELIDTYLDDAVLQRIQNEHGIHLCPSLSEGWGHYIAEGMSCQAVVITTDAPPMNELVDEQCGILVPWSTSQPRHLGTNFAVDPSALEAAVELAIHLDTTALQEKGLRARKWFTSNEESFTARFRTALSELRAA